MSSSIYLAIPVMLLMAVAQTAVLPRFPIAGVVPQLPLLIALAWGLLRGANDGAVWGFIAGLCLDIFSVGPMGATALTFMVSILAVSLVGRALPRNRYLMPILLAALATLIFSILNIGVMSLFGYRTSATVLAILIPETLLHSGMILPLYWVIYAIDRTLRPRSVTI